MTRIRIIVSNAPTGRVTGFSYSSRASGPDGYRELALSPVTHVALSVLYQVHRKTIEQRLNSAGPVLISRDWTERSVEGQGKLQEHGCAFAEAFADGADVAAVLAGYGAHEEEAEAGALDLDAVADAGAIEALEDAFELVRGQAETGVRDGEHGKGVALDEEATADVDAVGRVLHRIVEEVEDRCAEVFRMAEGEEADVSGDGLDGDGFFGEVIATEDGADALLEEGLELDAGALRGAGALAEFSGLEDLLDRGEEAVGVGAHDAVEVCTLLVADGTALEGVQIEADAGERGLELVGDGVEEAVLAVVAADLAEEEDGVEDDTGDQDAEEQDTQNVDRDACSVGGQPGDVERDGKADQADTQGDEEGLGSAAARKVHGMVPSIAAGCPAGE